MMSRCMCAARYTFSPPVIRGFAFACVLCSVRDGEADKTRAESI